MKATESKESFKLQKETKVSKRGEVPKMTELSKVGDRLVDPAGPDRVLGLDSGTGPSISISRKLEKSSGNTRPVSPVSGLSESALTTH